MALPGQNFDGAISSNTVNAGMNLASNALGAAQNMTAMGQNAINQAAQRSDSFSARLGSIAQNMIESGSLIAKQIDQDNLRREANILAPLKGFEASVGQQKIMMGDWSGFQDLANARTIGASNPFLQKIDDNALTAANMLADNYIKQALANKEYETKKMYYDALNSGMYSKKSSPSQKQIDQDVIGNQLDEFKKDIFDPGSPPIEESYQDSGNPNMTYVPDADTLEQGDISSNEQIEQVDLEKINKAIDDVSGLKPGPAKQYVLQNREFSEPEKRDILKKIGLENSPEDTEEIKKNISEMNQPMKYKSFVDMAKRAGAVYPNINEEEMETLGAGLALQIDPAVLRKIKRTRSGGVSGGKKTFSDKISLEEDLNPYGVPDDVINSIQSVEKGMIKLASDKKLADFIRNGGSILGGRIGFEKDAAGKDKIYYIDENGQQTYYQSNIDKETREAYEKVKEAVSGLSRNKSGVIVTAAPIEQRGNRIGEPTSKSLTPEIQSYAARLGLSKNEINKISKQYDSKMKKDFLSRKDTDKMRQEIIENAERIQKAIIEKTKGISEMRKQYEMAVNRLNAIEEMKNQSTSESEDNSIVPLQSLRYSR